jgi:hypothetical protein
MTKNLPKTDAASPAAPRRRSKAAPVPGGGPIPSPAASAPAPAPDRPVKGKLGAMLSLLQSVEGATVEAMMAATGWQAHSVRGAMSGAIKKKLGVTITSEKTHAGRVYRVSQGACA